MGDGDKHTHTRINTHNNAAPGWLASVSWVFVDGAVRSVGRGVSERRGEAVE